MNEPEKQGNETKIDPKTNVVPYYLAYTITQYDVDPTENGPSQLSDEKVELSKLEVDFNEK